MSDNLPDIQPIVRRSKKPKLDKPTAAAEKMEPKKTEPEKLEPSEKVKEMKKPIRKPRPTAEEKRLAAEELRQAELERQRIEKESNQDALRNIIRQELETNTGKREAARAHATREMGELRNELNILRQSFETHFPSRPRELSNKPGRLPPMKSGFSMPMNF
jgi:hypothetical protein